MKWPFLIALCLLQTGLCSQNPAEWFLEEIQRKAGVWQTSNSLYQSENEPYDHYLIEWVPGPEGKELYGQLYGLKGEDTSTVLWTYHQYYDPKAEAAMVKQVGQEGTTAMGVLIRSNDTLKLEQSFVSLGEVSHKEGHITKLLDQDSERITSYEIDEEGLWLQKRTYLWIKKK